LASTEDQLVQSYLAKQQANKTPTAAEAKAYQRALDSRVLSQLKLVSPDFFNQLFAIQNKQRYDWEERYEFPCGRSRKSIDVLAVLQAIKHLIAVNRKYLGVGNVKPAGVGDDIDINEAKRLEAIERRKKTEAQREKIQIELAALKRQLIPIEDVRECFDLICNVWIRVSKQLQKAGLEDAWEITESGLEEAREAFEKEMSPIDSAEEAADIAKLETKFQEADSETDDELDEPETPDRPESIDDSDSESDEDEDEDDDDDEEDTDDEIDIVEADQ
jgi:hypothetical protein